MKHILLFGAGRSATVLIDYLKTLSTKEQWLLTIADSDIDAVVKKAGKHPLVKTVVLNVAKNDERRILIREADVVISLLPPALHYQVALDCVHFEKHLLTASYIDDNMRSLEKEVGEKQLIFLCEMGLDPGIDHMSAMNIINRIKANNGIIKSFKSHCGGLVAPECDDNPWHYKISWNAKNMVNAGKAGAIYKENGLVKTTPYELLFANTPLLQVPETETVSYYPNRNSIDYIPIYQLEEAETFVRTTIRHPEFCFGWKNIVNLKLTDDTHLYDTDGMSMSDFFKVHLEKHDLSKWITEMLSTRLTFAKDLMKDLLQLIEKDPDGPGKIEEEIMLVNEKGELDMTELDDEGKMDTVELVALKIHEANLSLKQLFFLGLDSEEMLNKGMYTAAEVLEQILQKKLALGPLDKDMVLMVHEITYELDGLCHDLQSSLVLVGEDNMHTAMAKTVGLPLGIAARLILNGDINKPGLQIPVAEAIYKPILAELEQYGIIFKESEISGY